MTCYWLFSYVQNAMLAAARATDLGKRKRKHDPGRAPAIGIQGIIRSSCRRLK
jgi:hypothetical protein